MAEARQGSPRQKLERKKGGSETQGGRQGVGSITVVSHKVFVPLEASTHGQSVIYKKLTSHEAVLPN